MILNIDVIEMPKTLASIQINEKNVFFTFYIKKHKVVEYFCFMLDKYPGYEIKDKYNDYTGEYVVILNKKALAI